MRGELNLYDSREGRLKPVRSLRGDNTIRMYICGPTVYDYSHIGHFKTFIIYDSLVRLLKYLGYDVIHVVNITDIDDKIIKRALEEGKTYREISEEYTQDFINNWRALNLLPPYALPRATYHVRDMFRIISKLIEKGYAYVSDGNVYFSVRKFKGYGEISKQKISDLIAGYRVEEGPGKKDPLDFALWKRVDDEPYWDSPWGRGRPGWHIECTAMSTRFLDPPFEIHGGGEDLKFPHHENERAQTNTFIDGEAVYIWMHVGILKMNKEKMSKSLGNIVIIKDLIRNVHPDVVRILVLSTHYRKQSEYSEEKLIEAKNIYRSVKSTYQKLLRNGEGGNTMDVSKYRRRFLEALLDDFNTAQALNIFMSFVNEVDKNLVSGGLKTDSLTDAVKLFNEFIYIYGLRMDDLEIESEEIVKLLVEVRRELRKRKLYDVADRIREELSRYGYVLEDIGEKTIFYRL